MTVPDSFAQTTVNSNRGSQCWYGRRRVVFVHLFGVKAGIRRRRTIVAYMLRRKSCARVCSLFYESLPSGLPLV